MLLWRWGAAQGCKEQDPEAEMNTLHTLIHCSWCWVYLTKLDFDWYKVFEERCRASTEKSNTSRSF